ncbi:unnamed protein product [Cylindrotheca closterium]|uniref:RING-type domain-containing protein n=1 Tax=Cylindrotheca closterium TaxID=2856 RepID=A0AAD2FYQ6_9STRA|nr:unnamed protein product [Cylindrotheca closterium]
MNPSMILIGTLLLLIASEGGAQDPLVPSGASTGVPTGAPTIIENNNNPSNNMMPTMSSQPSPDIRVPTLAPTRPPSYTIRTTSPTRPFPTSSDSSGCYGNYLDWRYTVSYTFDGAQYFQDVVCDDSRVECWHIGNYGSARDKCCKCKPECEGQCDNPVFNDDFYYRNGEPYESDGYYDDDENHGGLEILELFLALVGALFCCGLLTSALKKNNEIQATRRTMAARRRQQQQQQASNGLSEAEKNHARYELFVTKFYFQTVLPDKSNITVASMRNNSMNGIDKDEERSAGADDESGKTESDNDHDDPSLENKIETETSASEQTLSQRLSSWRKPSGKDECCICLECYAVGETICAPITTQCDHVFHEGCINEWLKTNDKCPLCRVELLND